jgi:DNA-binding beta-propeller fold protein YncE
MYGLTNVGVIFEIDIKNLVVKRQIPANVSSTDFAIGRDGLFYLLDGTNSLVRLFNVNTGTTVRTVGVSGSATSIALTPDGQQIWLTHTTPAQVTVYTGNATIGFVATGAIAATIVNNLLTMPLRIFFSPSGSFAAVTNSGGWIDIVR